MTKEYNEVLAKALVKYPKARKIAVENFTFGAGSNGMHNALNLEADRKAYGWKVDTVKAIQMVLRALGQL